MSRACPKEEMAPLLLHPIVPSVVLLLPGGQGRRRDITLEEVRQHRTADDAWMVLHGKVSRASFIGVFVGLLACCRICLW